MMPWALLLPGFAVLAVSDPPELDAATRDLFVACDNGSVAEAKKALAEGASLEAKDWAEQTPLIASQSSYGDNVAGSVQVALLLMHYGANVRARDEAGRTALHFAGTGEVVRLLVRAGADRNALDRQGDTPLIACCSGGRYGAATALLELGADPNKGRAFDSEARSWDPMLTGAERADALRRSKENIADYLEPGWSSVGQTPLMTIAGSPIAYDEDLRMGEDLLRHGAKIDGKTQVGRTALHYAAASGNIRMAGWLLDHGAAVNARTKNGLTPLHCAMTFDSIYFGRALPIVDYLLRRGADPEARTLSGDTPLMRVEYWHRRNRVRATRYSRSDYGAWLEMMENVEGREVRNLEKLLRAYGAEKPGP